ncbi:MAG: hypothetical protein ACOYMV_11910 [Verrucomicrobiia bacterium]
MPTVKSALDDVLFLWGIEDSAVAPAAVQTQAVVCLNKALQVLWAGARAVDYFARETLTVSFFAGTSAITLGTTIQSILGPVRLADGTPLRRISTRSQFDDFGSLFLGDESVPTAEEPFAFFEETLRETSGAADLAKVRLHILPALSAGSADLLLDVATEAPRYAWADYTAGSTLLPISHQYAESLLYPVMRHEAMQSHYFFKAATRGPQIKEDYARAVKLLEAVTP